MSKKRRWVNGDKYRGGERSAPCSSSHLIEPERLSEDRPCRGDAEADDDARLNDRRFGFQPRPAGGNFGGGRFFVFAALALRFPFKVLDSIREINVAPANAGFHQRFVQDASGWSHEGMSLQVFLIARLLSDEHDRRMGGSFAKDGLGGMLVQVASRAAGCRLSQLRHAQMSGDECAGG